MSFKETALNYLAWVTVVTIIIPVMVLGFMGLLMLVGYWYYILISWIFSFI